MRKPVETTVSAESPTSCPLDNEAGWRLLNATTDSAFLIDRQGVLLAGNEHGARKLGASGAAALSGRSLAEFVPPEVFESRMAHVRKVFESGCPLRFEDEREGMVFDNNLAPVFDAQGRVGQVAVFAQDITKRRQGEALLRKRAFQQGVVAELGLFALSNLSLSDILDKTCRLVSTLFSAEYCALLELTPGQDGLRFAAGVGFPRELMESGKILDVETSQAGLALTSNSPVVVENLEEDRRIQDLGCLPSLGVKSGMSVVIHGKDRPYGVLEVHSISPRNFSEDEVHTLQAVANVLSEAVERFQAEKALADLSERNAAILSSVAQGIFGVDTAGRVTFANKAVERLTGFALEELLGKDAHWTLHHTRSDGQVYPVEDCPLSQTLADGVQRQAEEEVFWRKDGASFPVDYSCTPLFEGGRLQGAVTVFEDITERKRAQERLKRIAFFDELTGLANRGQMKTRLESVLARGGGSDRFAVLFLDLDDFKVVNDGLGHTLGDDLLRSLAGRLRQALGARGLLARMGGDEFAVLVEGADCARRAREMAQRIHHEMTQPERLQGYEIFISVSVGMVLDDGRYQSAEEVLRDADTAMFKAKTLGKGETALFDQAMHDAVRSRLMLENDLRRALERDELFLAYQPIVELASGRPTGFEALIRWQHPERGFIPPSDFIPVAEASGLILPVGEWVLAKACAQMAAWRALVPGSEGLSVSVNLSGRQFMQTGLPGRLARIVAQAGLPPSAVKLEITESVVMENAERAVEMLGELKNLGLTLMIDDFGTGYSSLAYLRRFPVDVLKLDRTFVRNVDSDRDNLQIARAVVQLAHSLELKVVAEGVETENERQALLDLGCALAQGYHFARPLSAGAAQEYLKNVRL